MKVIGVKHIDLDGYFTDSLTFYFKSYSDYKKNDTVLCETICGLALGKVVEESAEYPATRYIVSKVDLSEYRDGLERERKALEIKKKMKERKKTIEENDVYEFYATKDEEMANLLKEYKELKCF